MQNDDLYISQASLEAFKEELLNAGKEDIERFLYIGRIHEDPSALSKEEIGRLVDTVIDAMPHDVLVEQMANYGFKPSWVTLKVEGRYTTPVFAKDPEQAKQLAVFEYEGADFGELRDIEAEPVIVENEAGDFEWEIE